MRSNGLRLLTVWIAAAFVSFIFSYAGHFLFPSANGGKPTGKLPAAVPTAPQEGASGSPAENGKPPVRYVHQSKTLSGSKQEIHFLEIDPGAPDIEIKPVLSFDLLYGFELLSEMVARKNAYAAVNAGFFYQYGLPSGLVVIDGELITASTGKYPVLTIHNGEASLSQFKTKQWLNTSGGRVQLDGINMPGKKGEAVLYTPLYGRTNRTAGNHLTVVIRNDKVERIVQYDGEYEIPEDGALLTFYPPFRYPPENLPILPGETLTLASDPVIHPGMQAYECGSWLVRDGLVVAGTRDPWVGVLTNRDPRTAVGIKQDGTVIFLVVDGRQPGYSAGLTAMELARCMLDMEVVNAAMLDGGASSEMIVEGKVVNRPSFKGKERPLGGGLLVLRR